MDLMKRAVVDPMLVLHIVLYVGTVQWVWDREMMDTYVSAATIDAAVDSVDPEDDDTPAIQVLVAVVLVALHVWVASMVRKSALILCTSPPALREFAVRSTKVLGVVLTAQVFLVGKFIAWYFDTLPAARFAAEHRNTTVWKLEKDIAWSMCGPMEALVYAGCWYAVGSGLGTFGRSRTVVLQLLLLAYILGPTVFNYSWAEQEMSYGSELYYSQDTRASPCETHPMLTRESYCSRGSDIVFIPLPWIAVFALLALDARNKKNFQLLMRLPVSTQALLPDG